MLSVVLASSMTPYPGRFTKSYSLEFDPSTGSSISIIVVNSSGISVTADTTGDADVDSVPSSDSTRVVSSTGPSDDGTDDDEDDFGSDAVELEVDTDGACVTVVDDGGVDDEVTTPQELFPTHRSERTVT